MVMSGGARFPVSTVDERNVEDMGRPLPFADLVERFLGIAEAVT